MGNNVLDFEKPLIEMEEKILELRKFTDEKGIDFSEEITSLEIKAQNLKRDIYEHLTPWQKVMISRHIERPTAYDYINLMFTDFMELHGDRKYGDDRAIIGGIGRLNGQPVTVVGHSKGKETKVNIARNFGMPHPEGYRKALRLMKQAEKFQRPVICFIDTPGAYCGSGAEERGQAEAIAVNLLEMSNLKVPIVPIIIGEGGSGGALALGLGDQILMLEHSVYSILSPEGFSAILWKDASKASEAAEAMKITAQDLLTLGIIDQIIPEPLGGAHRDPQAMAKTLQAVVTGALADLGQLSITELVERRYQKFRGIGTYVQG